MCFSRVPICSSKTDDREDDRARKAFGNGTNTNRNTHRNRRRELNEEPEIAESRNRNREIAKSRNHEMAESRIGIGNRNRKHATSAQIGKRDLESEIAIGIGNQELEIGNRIANMPRQIRWSGVGVSAYIVAKSKGARPWIFPGCHWIFPYLTRRGQML